MTVRSIWSGTIQLGLVSVPVRMHSATESKELRFHFLHKDELQPIGYALRESVQETMKQRKRAKRPARKAGAQIVRY